MGAAARYAPVLFWYVLDICLLHLALRTHLYQFCSTRVANELGAGNPEAAKVAVWVVIALSMAEVIVASITLLCCRHILGYAFSNEKEVVNYLQELSPLVCILLLMDGIQAVLSGLSRPLCFFVQCLSI